MNVVCTWQPREKVRLAVAAEKECGFPARDPVLEEK